MYVYMLCSTAATISTGLMLLLDDDDDDDDDDVELLMQKNKVFSSRCFALE